MLVCLGFAICPDIAYLSIEVLSFCALIMDKYSCAEYHILLN